ncbi:uncharacterized protein LOC105199902 isoform X1 [Solenopsis invicta]|uniref:uncharacterized protein LOC105199902 isoform X1 n=1 Tax=Solenopsis invicta TaxID=13686 RepID=UPI00193DF2D0|nr:uncharacterized protein LOC105199902 isoform X1 [Solenopsis invicta]
MNIQGSEMKKKHIDDVQTKTVDEHYKLLLENNDVIDPEAIDVTSNDLPDWYDEKLYKEAQNYYKRNIMSIGAANITGLILTLSVMTILKVILYTKQSNSACSAFNRYMKTALHTHNLYTCDPNDTNSKWYKTINVIRWRHKVVTRKLKSAGMEEISQRDMVLTQYGFAGYVFIAPKYFGLCNTLEEDEAFNHFWRVNGYMLGISDSLNLCRKNAKETAELCQKIKELYTSYLSKPSPEFDRIMSNAIDGFSYIDITINKDIFLAIVYELHDLPYQKLRWSTWLNIKYRKLIIYLSCVPYIRTIIRIYNNFLASFLLWNLQNFPILAWLKFGKNNVQLNLYPKYAKLK